MVEADVGRIMWSRIMPINGAWRPFNEANINLYAPESHGVYALAVGTEITYYGRAQGGSTTIRSRLKDHLSGREGRCTQSALSFATEICVNPVAREKQLLVEYQQATGRLPRCNDRIG